MAVIRSVIRGVGAYLPKRVMTNNDIAQLVEHIAEYKDRAQETGRKAKDDEATVVSPIMQEDDKEVSTEKAEDSGEDEEDIYDFRVSQAG